MIKLFCPPVFFTVFSIMALCGLLIPSDLVNYYTYKGGETTCVVIYVLGCLSFIFGSVLSGSKSDGGIRPIRFNYSSTRMRLFVLLMVIVFAGFALVNILFFGNIPILSYASGDSDIFTTMDKFDSAALGQVGILHLLVDVASLPTIVLVVNSMYGSNGSSALRGAVFMFCFAVTASVWFAKRGPMFNYFLTCGSAIYLIYLINTKCGEFVGWGIVRKASVVIIGVGLAIALFASIGWMRNIRLNTQYSSVVELDSSAEICNYLAYPVFNFKQQCYVSGYLPGEPSVLSPIRFLLPYKIFSKANLQYYNPPPRVEPSSPSGFYEDLHWGWGVIGVLCFTTALGYFVMKMRAGVQVSPIALFVFIKCFTLIIFMSSFNYFLFQLYFLTPVIIMMVFVKFCRVSYVESGMR